MTRGGDSPPADTSSVKRLFDSSLEGRCSHLLLQGRLRTREAAQL